MPRQRTRKSLRDITKAHEKDVPFGIISAMENDAILTNEHRAQLLNYLRMTKSKLGLLITFAAYPKVRIERYAN